MLRTFPSIVLYIEVMISGNEREYYALSRCSIPISVCKVYFFQQTNRNQKLLHKREFEHNDDQTYINVQRRAHVMSKEVKNLFTLF